jgi:hypothetical protein
MSCAFLFAIGGDRLVFHQTNTSGPTDDHAIIFPVVFG